MASSSSRAHLARVVSVAALVAALAGCLGDAPALTPLNTATPSDHGRLSLVVRVDGGVLARGANDFVVEVQNLDGTPGVLTTLSAMMPSHGHTANTPTVADLGGGRFAVRSLELAMPGLWELDLSLSRDGATLDDRATVLTEVE